MLVEFTQATDGHKISINASAVAWVREVPVGPQSTTADIAISGKETELICVTESYADVVEALQIALEDTP